MLVLRVLLCVLCIYNVHSIQTISVYGDVYKDKDFFTKTFPWIIDNIGGDLLVDFYLQGSGRYTVPQMCALVQLRYNPYLQAQFLKCEAEGQPSEVCLCDSGIDSKTFRQCVLTHGNYASESAFKYLQVGIDVTPLIELGPMYPVYGVEDIWYLMKICTIFGDNIPRGCLKPFASNGTEELNQRRAIAQFDKCCNEMECRKSDHVSTTTTPMPSTTTSMPTTTTSMPTTTASMPTTTTSMPTTTTSMPTTTTSMPTTTTSMPTTTTSMPTTTTSMLSTTTSMPTSAVDSIISE